MNSPTTRQHIVEAADDLFYQQGFTHTSFSDIAKVVNISRGNFYHHFKTKDDILDAVIKNRLDKTEQMLTDWGEQDSPKARIKSYIEILITNWSMIKDYGCPVGTLCTEMTKLSHSSKDDSSQVFVLFRIWLKRQFSLLGHRKNADELAMQVLSWSQGVATLGNAFNDFKYVKREVKKMCSWLDSLCVQQP